MNKKSGGEKTRKQRSVKDEIGEKFLSLMPGLPQRMAKVWREVERFDGRRAATLMAKMQAAGEGYVPRRTGREAETLEEIRQLLAQPAAAEEMRRDFKELIADAKRRAFADGRASLLLRLISKADERLPLVSLALLLDHGHPLKSFRQQSEPVDLIAEAQSSRGEQRARAAVRAYREVAEWLYDPYARTLWKLACLARNEWQEEPKKFGNLVTQLARKLADYPGLVEADAGWRRNAAAHGHWEYVRADTLKMWDERHPPEEIAVDELYSKVEGMFRIAGPTLSHVAQLYLVRNVGAYTGLADALFDNLPRFVSTEESVRAAAERKMAAKVDEVFGPLRSFLDSRGQPPPGAAAGV